MSTYNDIRTRFQVGMNRMNEKEVPVEIDNSVVGTVDDSDNEVIDTIKTVVSSAGSKDAIIDFLKSIITEIIDDPFAKLADQIIKYEQREFPERWEDE